MNSANVTVISKFYSGTIIASWWHSIAQQSYRGDKTKGKLRVPEHNASLAKAQNHIDLPVPRYA